MKELISMISHEEIASAKQKAADLKSSMMRYINDENVNMALNMMAYDEANN